MTNLNRINLENILDHFKELTPAEKGCIDIEVVTAVEFICDTLWEQQEEITLAELIQHVVIAVDEHRENLKE